MDKLSHKVNFDGGKFESFDQDFAWDSKVAAKASMSENHMRLGLHEMLEVQRCRNFRLRSLQQFLEHPVGGKMLNHGVPRDLSLCGIRTLDALLDRIYGKATGAHDRTHLLDVVLDIPE